MKRYPQDDRTRLKHYGDDSTKHGTGGGLGPSAAPPPSAPPPSAEASGEPVAPLFRSVAIAPTNLLSPDEFGAKVTRAAVKASSNLLGSSPPVPGKSSFAGDSFGRSSGTITPCLDYPEEYGGATTTRAVARPMPSPLIHQAPKTSPALQTSPYIQTHQSKPQDAEFLKPNIIKPPSQSNQTQIDPKCKPMRPWNNPNLTRLNMYHPLEVYHVTFSTKRFSAVLQMLPRQFQCLSLQASYEDSPVAANCWSFDQVELRVCLFQSRKDKDVVILEIQRRAGDSINFSRYARPILAVVKELNAAAPAPVKPGVVSDPAGGISSYQPPLRSAGGGLPPPIPIAAPISAGCKKADNLVRRAIPGFDKENTIASALEIALGFLKCDRYDARQLGLESLSVLTDPVKVGDDIAVAVSKTVLCGTDSRFSRLQELVLPLAITGRWPGESDSGAFVMDFGTFNPHAFLALQVVSQAARVLSDNQTKEQDFDIFLSTAGRLCGKDLVAELLALIREAPSRPHGAYLSVVCLTAIAKVMPSVRELLQPDTPTVSHAQQVGCSAHAALDEASRELLVVLRAY